MAGAQSTLFGAGERDRLQQRPAAVEQLGQLEDRGTLVVFVGVPAAEQGDRVPDPVGHGGLGAGQRRLEGFGASLVGEVYQAAGVFARVGQPKLDGGLSQDSVDQGAVDAPAGVGVEVGGGRPRSRGETTIGAGRPGRGRPR